MTGLEVTPSDIVSVSITFMAHGRRLHRSKVQIATNAQVRTLVAGLYIPISLIERALELSPTRKLEQIPASSLAARHSR